MKIRLNEKITNKDLKIICHQIASMYSSGVDILTILDLVSKNPKKIISTSFRLIKKYIESGESITKSFAVANTFSKFFIGMIYTGEVSGNLEFVFARLSNYYDREYKLRSRILSSIIYPVILLIVSVVSILFILVFVIPNFEAAFDLESFRGSFGAEFLFKISRFLRENYVFILAFILLFLVMTVRFIKNEDRIRLWMCRKKYKIPILRKIFNLVILDKFSRSLSILVESGVNISEALSISISTLDDRYIEGRLKQVINYIESGNSITNSFAKTGVFPEIYISMISSGEQGGRFDESLKMIAVFYQEEVDIEIEKLMKLFEPIMIVIMGLFIGGIVISIMSPIFDMISSVGY